MKIEKIKILTEGYCPIIEVHAQNTLSGWYY